jgi:hypothetical protein
MAPFTLAQTLAIATNTRTRQVAMNHAKRKLQAQGLGVSATRRASLLTDAQGGKA